MIQSSKDEKIIVTTIEGSKTLQNVQEKDIYDAPEVYIVLLHIKIQFKVLKNAI